MTTTVIPVNAYSCTKKQNKKKQRKNLTNFDNSLIDKVTKVLEML